MTTVELDLARWRTLARIGHAASSDALDGILVGLRLQLDAGRLIATANNRYVLAKNQVKITGPSDGTFDGAVVARQALLIEKDIRSLERYRDKKKHSDASISLKVEFADEWVEVSLADDGSLLEPESISRRMDLLGGTFPEVGDVFDRALAVPLADRLGRLGANPDYLTMVARTVAWEDLGSPLTYLNPPAGDDRMPMVVRCTADELWQGLVMPVRMPE